MLSSFRERCVEAWDARKTAELNRRALSVQYLATTFLQEVYMAGMTRESSIYQLENLDQVDMLGIIRQKGASVRCPLDGRLGAAYVHCVQGRDNVGTATQILSYSWSYTIGDIVDTLVDFCKSTGRDPKRTYVWICCFCINQHRVASQKANSRSGTISPDPAVDFFKVFGDRVMGTGHLLAMMAPWHNPVYLQRIWCIFEMHTAQRGNCQVSVLMPPREKAAFEQDILGESGSGFQALMKALSRTRVQKAKASVEADRQSILDIVNHDNQGYGTLNFQVNELLRAWVLDIVSGLSKRRILSWNGEEESLENARACNKIGLLLNKLGQHEAALEKYRKALQIHLALRKKENSMRESTASEIAICCNNIGMALYTKGNYEDALEEFQSAVTMQEKKLGKKHAETATTYNNIGTVMEAQGHYKDALQYYRKALKAREATQGKQHPDTATSHNNVGSVLSTLGQWKDALFHHKSALSIRRNVLGKRHPDTATSYNNIGMILRSEQGGGDLDGALEMYEKALKITELVLGKEHPNTATAYNNIAMVLHDKKEHVAALVEFKKALTIHESVLGMEHPDTATSYNNIGIVLKALDDLDGALEAFKKALKIYEKVFGWKHPKTGSTYSHVARIQVTQGSYEEALENYKKALVVLKLTSGKEHLETAQGHMNVAFVLNAKGNMEAANTEYGYAMEILEKEAQALEDSEKYDEALVQYRKLMEIKETMVGADNLGVAVFRDNVGRILRAKGDHGAALDEYRIALRIREAGLFKGHPAITKNEKAISRVLQAKLAEDALAAEKEEAAKAEVEASGSGTEATKDESDESEHVTNQPSTDRRKLDVATTGASQTRMADTSGNSRRYHSHSPIRTR